MKKIILGGIAVIVLAVVGMVSYLYINADSLVKKAIETYGSQVAGVKVSVSSVKLDIPGGKASISGLAVANPSGFNSPTAFKLGDIAVALNTSKSGKSLIDITRVLVAAPEVTYELGQGGISNIQTIQNNVQAFTAKAGGGSEAKSDDSKNAVKLVIDTLDITGGKVTLATPVPGLATGANLGDIHLTGIGRENGGASPQQVAMQVLGALSKAATKAVGSIGVGNLTDAAKNAVNSVTGGGDAAKALNGLLGK